MYQKSLEGFRRYMRWIFFHIIFLKFVKQLCQVSTFQFILCYKFFALISDFYRKNLSKMREIFVFLTIHLWNNPKNCLLIPNLTGLWSNFILIFVLTVFVIIFVFLLENQIDYDFFLRLFRLKLNFLFWFLFWSKVSIKKWLWWSIAKEVSK